MKILFSTDLHGQQSRLDQLVELTLTVRPEGLILGGDILPDAEPATVETVQIGFALGPLRNCLQQLHQGLPDLRAAMVFGNHEMRCSIPAMEQLSADGLIELLQPDRVVRWGRLALVGYACTPPCPYWAKDFERLDLPGQEDPFPDGYIWNEQLGQLQAINAVRDLQDQPSMQEELAEIPAPPRPWILVAHSPPAGLGLDRLDSGLDIGSRAVLDFIRRHQPDISLHGHAHDAPRITGHYWNRQGRTIAINPGQPSRHLAAGRFNTADPIATLTPHGVELEEAASQPKG